MFGVNLGGEVRICVTSEATDDGDHAVITIEDHGIGIPGDDLPRIFNMFHRASNAQSRVRGTGLGLASVRSIVEQHGGHVDVASTEGVGSTFTVRLPTR
jgi:signal transduction histidine kinase